MFYVTLRNIARVTYVELLFALRIPASLIYVFLMPNLLLLLFGSRFSDPALLIAGVTAFVTGVSTLQGVGQVVVTMRRGVWKTIQVSMDPAWLYLAGVICSRVLRTFLVCALLLVSAWIAFEYQVRGSLMTHASLVLLGSVACAAIGLCLAYVPASPAAASNVLTVYILMVLLASGMLPGRAHEFTWLAYVSPLTPLAQLLQANAEARSHPVHWWVTRVAVLFAWGAVAAVGALVLSRRREDEVSATG